MLHVTSHVTCHIGGLMAERLDGRAVMRSFINQTDRVRAPAEAAENLEADHVCRRALQARSPSVRYK